MLSMITSAPAERGSRGRSQRPAEALGGGGARLHLPPPPGGGVPAVLTRSAGGERGRGDRELGERLEPAGTAGDTLPPARGVPGRDGRLCWSGPGWGRGDTGDPSEGSVPDGVPSSLTPAGLQAAGKTPGQRGVARHDGVDHTGGMAARKRVPVLIDADQMETVRRVAEWTERSEDDVIADALTSYLDDQVMAVANEEVHAVRAERRARATQARAS